MQMHLRRRNAPPEDRRERVPLLGVSPRGHAWIADGDIQEGKVGKGREEVVQDGKEAERAREEDVDCVRDVEALGPAYRLGERTSE